MRKNWRSNLINLAYWFLALLTALILTWIIVGCAATQPQRIESNGQPAEPPMGWVMFCAENPKHAACEVRK